MNTDINGVVFATKQTVGVLANIENALAAKIEAIKEEAKSMFLPEPKIDEEKIRKSVTGKIMRRACKVSCKTQERRRKLYAQNRHSSKFANRKK